LAPVSGSHRLLTRQRLSGAQFDAIMGEQSKIKQVLGTLLQGGAHPSAPDG
jgi:hypothetical protein